MPAKCRFCKSNVAKHKTFCNRSCSASYSNRHRKLSPTDRLETKRVSCRCCKTANVKVNKRADPSKVRCLRCKNAPKLRLCVRCNTERDDVKRNKNTVCLKCYEIWTLNNSIFSTVDPDWSRTNVCGGYRVVFCPGHPRAFGVGYVHVHVVKAEQKIGRFLRRGEIVHHKDENKFNNHKANLLVFSSHSAHSTHHSSFKQKILVKRRCSNCNKMVKRRKGADAKAKGYARTFCDRGCYHEFLRK